MVLPYLQQIWKDFLVYEYALFYYLFRGGSFTQCPVLGNRLHASIHIYAMALDLRLWSKPHYRKPSYQQDLLDNLRNVAIPGTGLPLSILARSWLLAAFFYIAVNPFLCILAAFNDVRSRGPVTAQAMAASFREHLMEPQNWYDLWRINSRLAAWHEYLTKSKDYAMENKWTFMQVGEERGVAVAPFLKEPVVVAKHKNEEGGLAIHFFKNAASGGDWILQKALSNDDFLTSLLPENAPLSTIRVITASKGGLEGEKGVKVLSCVLRAGRANAKTDHSSVMFNVDVATGEIREGLSNAHWYKVGVQNMLTSSWRPPPGFTHHPDNKKCFTGVKIPDFTAKLQTCIEAHEKLCPEVPLSGWDLALTKEAGPCLLEANLSCNFFKGSFDQDWYFNFIRQYFAYCESLEARQKKEQKRIAD
mmetsp:Transcript_68540/g.164613  ORF Transcript_68540/g.164613 Transcript_68540/m.164613 type:complete len:418 (-) Transcript_68540:161-1414(-)